MHRWFGSQAESDKQASDRESRAAERNARAARRTISSFPHLPSDSSEDEYNDCDTSLLFNIGVDGADDESADMVDAAAAAAEDGWAGDRSEIFVAVGMSGTNEVGGHS